MRWTSIDPAKGNCGIAVWHGDKLIETLVIKPRGNKGKYYAGDEVYESRYLAYNSTLRCEDAVVMEKGAGGRMNIVNAQGFIRGYIYAVCESNGIQAHTISVSEWRRCIREAYDISWPKSSELKKALAVKQVKRIYGIDVTEDEADAVLIGVAALRMGLVEGTN